MKKRSKQASSISGSEDFSGTSHGLYRPSISRASTYTERSNYTSGSVQSYQDKSILKKRANTRSWSVVFTSCFIPTRGSTKEDDDEPMFEEDSDVSYASTSKKSIASNSSALKLRRRDSDSSNSIAELPTKFSINQIYRATSNFSAENQIGQGGFGTVYKGRFRDGSLIAIKRAKKIMYDNQLSAEFRSEIETLSKIEHFNLVRFLGYLEHEDERLIMVEYVNNGSLREHLDGIRGDVLELLPRLNIATDIAHAVAYLHEYADHPIIHRDIKSSNILLTDTFRAKVADFGFARLAPDNPDATHVSTQVKGTAGYVDPEYIRTYQLTEKSDVYSFGVLLVELVTGRRPIERGKDQTERMTTKWAIRKYREGDTVIAMDTKLRRSPASVRAVEKMMKLAEECMNPSRKSRPSMRKCGEDLWAIRRDFQHQQQRQQQNQSDSASSNKNTTGSHKESFPGLREE
ncbi:Calmodulin-binding receptor-like cytoplasmic kinase 2 [Rhynchospora pubera]|uniref:non-specific serine/threonine protein kinase n=1 Tax=Rhynchospora pubera TaxID=906938 RepID=A0AAV8DL20_9POAL|nr:Calmodulin-binding receptor-like cytoplasmic kinase 2 [Rhynchospora pubera]